MTLSQCYVNSVVIWGSTGGSLFVKETECRSLTIISGVRLKNSPFVLRNLSCDLGQYRVFSSCQGNVVQNPKNRIGVEIEELALSVT